MGFHADNTNLQIGTIDVCCNNAKASPVKPFLGKRERYQGSLVPGTQDRGLRVRKPWNTLTPIRKSVPCEIIFSSGCDVVPVFCFLDLPGQLT